eukprot:gene10538-2665_t
MGQLLSIFDCALRNRNTFTVGTRSFIIKKRVASGGFSVIELVQDVQTSSFSAMKRMPCTELRELEIAQNEAKYYSLFQHPNIITLVESATISSRFPNASPTDQEVVCVFPYFECGTLFDYVEELHSNGGFLPELEVLSIFKGICLALDQMHTRVEPLCHRDVKPANVLLTKDRHPVLMDFGSVESGHIEVRSRKQAVEQQDRAAQRTTLPFRPPELIDVPSSIDLTTAVDIWSLGCTLYSMAYLHTPFEFLSQKGASLPLAIAQGNISFPEQDPYTPTLRELILSMIKVNPSARPSISEACSITFSLS